MRKLLTLAVVLLALFAACSKPGPGGKHFDEGVRQLRAGDPITAFRTFTALDSLESDSPYGSYGKALYYEKEQMNLNAVRAYEKTLELFPEFFPALISYARLSLDIGRPMRARIMAERAYRLEKYNPETMAVLVDALSAAGEMPKARRGIKEALIQNPEDPLLLLADARFRLHSGEFDRAMENCRQAVKSKPTAATLKQAGDIYRMLGLSDSASVRYRQALDRDKKDFYLRADIADIFIDMGYLFEARRLIESLSASPSRSHRYYQSFKKLYEALDQPFAAFSIYLDAYMHFANSPSVLIQLAHLRFVINQDPAAVSHYEQALLWAESNLYSVQDILSIKMDRAEQLFDRGHEVAASAEIKDILDDPPNEYPIIRVVSLYYSRLATVEQLTEMLKTLDGFTEGNTNRMLQTGDVYRRIDSLQRALSWYDRVLELDKLSHGAAIGKMLVFKQMGKPQKALAVLDGLDEYVSLYKTVAVEKYNLLMDLTEYNQALAYARDLIDAGPHDIGRYQMAIRAAEALGADDEVAGLYRMCLDRNPDNAYAHSFAAEHYLTLGEREQAKQHIARSTALDSTYLPAHIMRARLLLANGKTDSVKAIYKWVLTKNEYVDEALTGLVRLTLEHGGDYREAYNFASKACQVDNRNPLYMVLLGRVQGAMERYDLARSTYKYALTVFPDNAELNFYAGANYIKDKKPDKAKEHLKRALNLGLAEEQRREAEELLGTL
ncbi:MAG: hypothetical protein JSV44_08740 [Candidatus Zixiibacteriota bacterium]|nr:MAG: hypothetical protein JSV44_08740 [candidate division Zixibacteria bacterium]